jgi:hypothetical protein
MRNSGWLGREDSNLQMGDPKSPDLPFVDAPTKKFIVESEKLKVDIQETDYENFLTFNLLTFNSHLDA